MPHKYADDVCILFRLRAISISSYIMQLFFILKAIPSTGKNINADFCNVLSYGSCFCDREARRIYQEAKGVFAKWARKAGCYGCKVCGQADSAESPMLLCDHCCQGIHQNCFLLPGCRVLSLLTQVCRISLILH